MDNQPHHYPANVLDQPELGMGLKPIFCDRKTSANRFTRMRLGSWRHGLHRGAGAVAVARGPTLEGSARSAQSPHPGGSEGAAKFAYSCSAVTGLTASDR